MFGRKELSVFAAGDDRNIACAEAYGAGQTTVFVGDIKRVTTKLLRVDAITTLVYVPIISTKLALARTDGLTISMLTLRRRE